MSLKDQFPAAPSSILDEYECDLCSSSSMNGWKLKSAHFGWSRYQIIQLIKGDVEVFADVLSLDLHIFQFYQYSPIDIDALVLYS